MPAESQKLIAYGKVMDNPDSTLKDYKIADGGFIVVMMQKVSGIQVLESWNDRILSF